MKTSMWRAVGSAVGFVATFLGVVAIGIGLGCLILLQIAIAAQVAP